MLFYTLNEDLEDDVRYTSLGVNWTLFAVGLVLLTLSGLTIFVHFFPDTAYHPEYKLPAGWIMYTIAGFIFFISMAVFRSSLGVVTCKNCGVPLAFSEVYFPLEADSRVVAAVTQEHANALVGLSRLGNGFSRMHIKLFYCPKCRFTARLGASRIDPTYGEVYFQPLKEIHGDNVDLFIRIVSGKDK